MTFFRFLIFSPLFMMLFQTQAFAQKVPLDKDPLIADGKAYQISYVVSQEVLSPFCPGKTLAMCTSPNAAAVRREIQMWATQGKNVKEIKEQLFEEYGEQYRMVDPPWWDNFGLFLGIGLGFIIAGIVIVSITKKSSEELNESDLNEESDDSDKFDNSDESDETPLTDDDYRDALRSEYND